MRLKSRSTSHTLLHTERSRPRLRIKPRQPSCFYKVVLGVQLPWLNNVVQAKITPRLPVVLTQAEVGRLLAQTDGTMGLFAHLLYSTGMRLKEGLRLRVKDIDFERREVIIREGKGGKDRVTMLRNCWSSLFRSTLPM